jgi:hypothetical protein
MIQNRVLRDAIQPGVERRLALKGVELGIGLEEGVLHQIFHLGTAAQVVAHQSEHAGLVTLYQHRESLAAAVQGLLNQLLVGLLVFLHTDYAHGPDLDAPGGFLFLTFCLPGSQEGQMGLPSAKMGRQREFLGAARRLGWASGLG